MTVRQKFLGDGADLISEYDKILKKQTALEQQISKTSATQKRAHGSTQRGVAAVGKGIQANIQSVAQQVVGVMGLQAAYRLVTNEIERQERLAAAAAARTITLGEAQAKVVKNIGLGVSDQELGAFLGKIDTIQKKTGFQSESQLNLAASGVLSATAGNQKMTLDILETSAPFFKDAPDQLGQFSSAMGDLMRVTENPNAKEALGLMLAIQGQARFEELGAFKNVAPAIASSVVTQKGVDKTQATREAAALFAAIGGRAGDADGAITKTAVANLSSNLATVLAKSGPVDDPFQLGESVLDRLARVQGMDRATQMEVLKSGFKGSIKPIMQELVTDPNSQTSKMVTEALGKIVASDQLVADKQRQLESGSVALSIATGSKKAESIIDDLETGDARATAGYINDLVGKGLDATGFEDFGAGYDSWKRKILFSFTERTPEEALKVLGQRRSDLLANGQNYTGPVLTAAEMSANRQAELKALDSIIDELVDIKNNGGLMPQPQQQTNAQDERD